MTRRPPTAPRSLQPELEGFGHRTGRPWPIGTALRCRGLLEATAGAYEAAAASQREAMAVWDQHRRPVERARTLLALGIAQRRGKRRGEARVSLEAAAALFGELGAGLWQQQAREEVARLGGRRARDRDDLTSTERRVAAEAADGRTNREIAAALFVSERTVEANLTRVYRKLGVRSRAQLARRLPDC